MRDRLNFSFFGRGDVSPTHSEPCRFVSGSGKTPGLISRNNYVKKIVCIGHRDNVLARWLDLPFVQVSRSVEQDVHTTFSFPNPLSESEVLQSCGCPKILLSFLMRFSGHFLTNQQQQQCLPHFESILDGHISRHLPAPFRLEIETTTWKRLIGSEHHSHKPFAPILVFLSQIDRHWNKILWQLSVLFRHPWRVRKTGFTRQVITRTLSKINKRTLCVNRCWLIALSGLADR